MANGTIDIECGSTTNTLTRQKQVAFAPITFITGTKLLVKKSSKIKSYKDLKDKTVVVTQGTTNERDRSRRSPTRTTSTSSSSTPRTTANPSSRSSPAARSPSRWTTSCSTACIAKAKNPKDFEVVGDYLSYDPYGMMFRKNDDDFGVVVRRAIAQASSQRRHQQDLQQVVPRASCPRARAMGVPMSPLLKAGHHRLRRPSG